jgi:hypothetical protein
VRSEVARMGVIPSHDGENGEHGEREQEAGRDVQDA